MVDLSDKPNRKLTGQEVLLYYIKKITKFRSILLVLLVITVLYVFTRTGDPIDNNVRSILKITQRKCLKNTYKDFLLVVSFSEPYYKDNDFVRGLYKDVFGRVVICGAEPDAHSGRFVPDIELEIDRGLYGYACMGKAIAEHPKYSGYFYATYDVIINWWNLYHFDTKRIWMLKQDANLLNRETTNEQITTCNNYRMFLKRISNAKQFKALWLKYQNNNNNNIEINSNCMVRPSKFFYIPQQFTERFSMMSNAAQLNRLDLHTGPVNIIQSLDSSGQIEEIPEYYRPPQYGYETSPLFWEDYKAEMTIAHSFRLYRKNPESWKQNRKILYEKYFQISKKLVNC